MYKFLSEYNKSYETNKIQISGSNLIMMNDDAVVLKHEVEIIYTPLQSMPATSIWNWDLSAYNLNFLGSQGASRKRPQTFGNTCNKDQ